MLSLRPLACFHRIQRHRPALEFKAGPCDRARRILLSPSSLNLCVDDVLTHLGRMAITVISQSGLFSAVASAFIIDIQSELSPDYERANSELLEMLPNATTSTLSQIMRRLYLDGLTPIL